jgi:CRP/FNR family cyclic AMP-dependent transcriptional regulator
MKKVENMSSMSQIKKRQPIYFPDEPSRWIFFLKEGHVKISRLSEDGKELILDIVGPGEIFGELSFVEDVDQSRNEIAVTLDDGIICAMSKEDFETILKNNPELNFEVTKRIGLRLRKIEERVTDLVFKDVEGRVTNFLVRYAEEFGKIQGGVVKVRPFLSHQEIAFLTGCSRQTVTTILNDLKTQHLIDISHKTLVIQDLPALKRTMR